MWQLWVPETRSRAAYADLRDALVSDRAAPRTWYSGGAYNDNSARLVETTAGRDLRIDPAAVERQPRGPRRDAPAGRSPFTLNLGAGPRIVAIDGIERVGRTRAGLTVARRSGSAAAAPVTVTIAPAGGAVRAGQIVSLLALLGLVATAAIAAVRRRRKPVRARSAP